MFKRYKESMKEAYTKLQKYDTKVIETSFGRMVYSIKQGKGIPILVVHGIVGGYDQAIETGISLAGEDQTIVGISRFGYLGSELPKDGTPKNQALVYTEILKELDIDKVLLLATSAGGTIALKFAILFPEKTVGVILVGSGAPSSVKQKGPSGPPKFIYNDYIFWVLLRRFRITMMAMFGVSKTEYREARIHDQEGLDKLLDTILPIKPRRPGIFNDEKVINPDMITNYHQYQVEELETPFLVLHAKNDPMAKYDRMKQFVIRLKNVDFVEYERGGHVLFGHGDKNNLIITDFIETLDV